jgi:hypothetical protein
MSNVRLRSVCEGVWTAERDVGFGWHNGMYVVQLPGGGLLLHSPTRLGQEMMDEIAALGPVEILLAPNHFHHLGLPSYRERFPQAAVVCSSVARKRLEKKDHTGLQDLSSVAPLLGSKIKLLAADGCKNGEVFVVIESGASERRWITCDAFFHENRPLKGFKGWVVKKLKTAPGLCLGGTFKMVGIGDKAAYRQWITQTLAEMPPTEILFSHGEPYRVSSVSEISALIARRL